MSGRDPKEAPTRRRYHSAGRDGPVSSAVGTSARVESRLGHDERDLTTRSLAQDVR